jgi:3-hydroxyacyl-CoA dehydrogenase
MDNKIEKAGVIGAGVMGATIAAQLANVGIETVLLDILPPSGLSEDDKKKGLTEASSAFRNRLALAGVAGALKAKPASFYLKENAELIHVGNLVDDLERLRDVQWIIEVVVERLDIKQAVFEKIESVLEPGVVVSSNTSGISAEAMCEGRSKQFREHFLITHFFNPPRYMKLLEIVPGPETLPSVTERLTAVCERQIGKGVVFAKDTPNFVANRIGVFSIMSAISAMAEMKLSIGATDLLSGPIVGRPKSALFRTADLVGLDTLVHVAKNVYDGAPDDEQRERFVPPPFIEKMVEKNLLGEKTGKGFYKKSRDEAGKRVILALDYESFAFKEQEKAKFGSVEAAKAAGGTKNKIKSLYYAKDVAGDFTFKTLTETLIYAANRIPEIADDIVSIDNGMKWGFGWKLGPFETWDAIGVAKSVEKMKAAGFEVPPWIEAMLDSGKTSFYSTEDGALSYYDIETKAYKSVAQAPGIILLPSLKAQNKVVATNTGATLVDIGDGVACLEFHAKMNAIGEDIINMFVTAKEIVERDFEGLVIANHGNHFSAGANLPLILFTAQEEEWDDLEYMVKTLQDAFMAMKYLCKPVVAAPAGMALGGGAEVCLCADRVRFAAETYMGLVEVGVGLLPAGGGTKEMLLRNTEHLFVVPKGGLYPKQIDMTPFVARAFETIAMAKVSASGPDAVQLGLLRPSDKMTVNRDYLIEDAKKTVLAMNLEGYVPKRPKQNIRVPGENTLALIKLALFSLHEAGYITDHDLTVSSKVAHVLTGGNVLEGTEVSEQYLLDLEREAFLSLAGEPMTHARIQHMLEKGKPLRN